MKSLSVGVDFKFWRTDLAAVWSGEALAASAHCLSHILPSDLHVPPEAHECERHSSLPNTEGDKTSLMSIEWFYVEFLKESQASTSSISLACWPRKVSSSSVVEWSLVSASSSCRHRCSSCSSTLALEGKPLSTRRIEIWPSAVCSWGARKWPFKHNHEQVFHIPAAPCSDIFSSLQRDGMKHLLLCSVLDILSPVTWAMPRQSI